MGIIKVSTSQCCCEIKLDRTIGLSFNLKVMQVEGAPRDGSYLQTMSLRLGCLESKPGTCDSGPAAKSAPSGIPDVPAFPAPTLTSNPKRAGIRETQPRQLGPSGAAELPQTAGFQAGPQPILGRPGARRPWTQRPWTQPGKSSRSQTPKVWEEANAHLTWNRKDAARLTRPPEQLQSPSKNSRRTGANNHFRLCSSIRQRVLRPRPAPIGQQSQSAANTLSSSFFGRHWLKQRCSHWLILRKRTRRDHARGGLVQLVETYVRQLSPKEKSGRRVLPLFIWILWREEVARERFLGPFWKDENIKTVPYAISP